MSDSMKLRTLPIVLLALAFVGCGDDTVPFGPTETTPTSPVVLENYAEVMPEATLPPNICELIPSPDNFELLCNASEFCGDGGMCVIPIGRPQGQ